MPIIHLRPWFSNSKKLQTICCWEVFMMPKTRSSMAVAISLFVMKTLLGRDKSILWRKNRRVALGCRMRKLRSLLMMKRVQMMKTILDIQEEVWAASVARQTQKHKSRNRRSRRLVVQHLEAKDSLMPIQSSKSTIYARCFWKATMKTTCWQENKLKPSTPNLVLKRHSICSLFSSRTWNKNR